MEQKLINSNLISFTGVVEEGSLYTVDIAHGWLMEYNTKNYTYRILTHMDCMLIEKGWYLIRKLIKIGDMFYFFLQNSRDVISWSLSKGVFQIYGNEHQYEQQELLVSNAFHVEDKIWICPAYSDQPIRCFDIHTKKVVEYSSIEKQMSIQGIELTKRQLVFASIENQILWFAVYKTPYVASYNLEKDQWDFYIFNKFGEISGLTFDGNDLWIFFMNTRKFISWQPEHGIIETFEISDQKLDMSKGDPYSHIYGFRNNIYVVPTYDNSIYIIDRKTKEIYATDFIENYKRMLTWPTVPSFYACIQQNERLILLPYSVNVFVEIDMGKGVIRCIESRFDYKELAFYFNDCYNQGYYLRENDQITIREYLLHVEFGEEVGMEQEKKGSYGKLIFDEGIK